MKKVKWESRENWLDNSKEYSFEGRWFDCSADDLKIIICSDKRCIDRFSNEKKKVDLVSVRYEPTETEDDLESIRTLKEAKLEALKLYNEYIDNFNLDEEKVY